MDNLKIFNHEMFGEIRTMNNENGETFFVGKDIAEALGYKNPSNALQIHVENEDKTSYLIQVSGSNYKANTLLINESGLYALILSSKLPQAKVFKHWVTSDVLPQIRKTGAYKIRKRHLGQQVQKTEKSCIFAGRNQPRRRYVTQEERGEAGRGAGTGSPHPRA